MGAGPIDAIELASAIEKWAGVDASVYAAERLYAMSRSGDAVALRRFEEVVARLGEREPHIAPSLAAVA